MQWKRNSIFMALALIMPSLPAIAEESAPKFIPNSSLLFGPGGLESTNAPPQYNFTMPAPVQYAPAPAYRPSAPQPSTPANAYRAPAPSNYGAPAAGLDQQTLSEMDAMRQAAMQQPPAPPKEPANDRTDAANSMDMNAIKQAAEALQASGQPSDSTQNASGAASSIPGMGDLSKMGMPGDLGSLLQGLPQKIQKFNDAYKEVYKELEND